MIYHILGSNIPHHNQTVLSFFQNELLPKVAGEHCFYVVGDKGLVNQYPSLKLVCFESKKALAKAVVTQAQADKQGKFLLHGQFNFPLWLAILCGRLPASRCYWHIWGADLYQDSPRLIFKLLYPIRTFAQKRLLNVLGTQGDLAYFAKINAKAKRELIYFPTKMNPDLVLPEKAANEDLTILLGNSGDVSNRHLQALEQIKQQLGEKVKIIVPMGYPENNQAYIEQVKQKAESLFAAGQVEILQHKLAFDDYLKLLSRCDLGYFIFERQQGIGTICLLTQCDIPVVLHRNNPFGEDMLAEKIPFLYSDELSREKIALAQKQINALDKSQIRFFYPNYLHQWLELLAKMAE